MPQAKVNSIYRYPVKGLSPEPLDRIRLEPGQTIPYDRSFAIENGGGVFNPANPEHMAKIHFLMLMKNERLAGLETSFTDDDQSLTILHSGQQVAHGKLMTDEGRKNIEQFFTSFMADELRGSPRLVHAPGHSISDVKEKCLSIINLESVRDLAEQCGCEINPLRFRANIYLDNLAPFEEFNWVGKDIEMGAVKLRVFKRTRRCAAINVDPATASRNMNLPKSLMKAYGHTEMGVYALVKNEGEIAINDSVMPPA